MKRKSHAAEKRKASVLADILKTLAILLAACLLCEVLYRLDVGEQDIIVVMVLAVFITAASTEGYWYGLGATVAGVLAYDFLVTRPRFGFSVTLGFPITFSIMLLVTLVTSTITARLKERMRIAQRKEKRAERLYEINRRLLSSRDEGSIAKDALEYLREDVQRSVALLPRFGDTQSPEFYFSGIAGDVDAFFFSRPEEQAAARAAAESRRPAGAGTELVPEAEGCYWPVEAQDTVYGVFGISCRKGPLPESHQGFLELLAGQTAQALRVQVLAGQRQEARVMAETEKARNSFLRGISHDLRTPLTSIIGASATLAESRDELSPRVQAQLAEGIQDDAQWLLSMVENILSVTRIHQSGMAIVKTEEAAEEVVGEAVSLFRRRHPQADILIHPAEEVLLVPMDALLITQVINNLLDNALRHSGKDAPQIEIRLQAQNRFAEFVFSDDGLGIDEAVLPELFAIHPARDGHGEDATRGLGIGLSICKTIVEVHGGWIEAENLPGGGARFTFALPMEQEESDGE